MANCITFDRLSAACVLAFFPYFCGCITYQSDRYHFYQAAVTQYSFGPKETNPTSYGNGFVLTYGGNRVVSTKSNRSNLALVSGEWSIDLGGTPLETHPSETRHGGSYSIFATGSYQLCPLSMLRAQICLGLFNLGIFHTRMSTGSKTYLGFGFPTQGEYIGDLISTQMVVYPFNDKHRLVFKLVSHTVKEREDPEESIMQGYISLGYSYMVAELPN